MNAENKNEKKVCLNILFHESMEFDTNSTHFVHIHELANNLSRIGYKVMFTEIVPSKNHGNINFKQSSLKERLRQLEIRRFILSLVLVFNQKRKPDLVYMRHGAIFNSGYYLAKILRIPFIKEVNGIFADEANIWKSKRSLFARFLIKLEMYNLPKADKIIVVTENLKHILQTDYNVSGNKIFVVKNGANIELFKPMDTAKARYELDLIQNYNYICFVGSLSPHQGVDYLIESAPLVLEKCPNTIFMIVGYGEQKEELINMAEKRGILHNFIFTGAVPYEKVPLYINACDLCVVPKKPWRCGYSPLKLHEYMACGKPVVATRTEGFEDLENYYAGTLVNYGDEDQFANSIVKLISDSKLRELMGKNAREYVIRNYSWEAAAKKVAEVCEAAVSENRNFS